MEVPLRQRTQDSAHYHTTYHPVVRVQPMSFQASSLGPYFQLANCATSDALLPSTKHLLLVVRYGPKIVICGTRTANVPWTMKIEAPNATLQAPPMHQPMHIGNHLSTLEMQTASDRIAFFHAAARHPVMSPWIQAIKKGFYTTWPGLTVQAIRCHLPKLIITTMGILDQQRKNKQSTKER